ncbi:MAG: hypothetical protein WAR37_00035 [Candidatus Microsaccharimonas sp.]
MSTDEAKQLLDKIVGSVFGYQNPFTLDEAMQKFAFDLRLPQQVQDYKTGQPTWASSLNPSKFIAYDNVKAGAEEYDWMIPKRDLNSVEDVIVAWAETNATTGERVRESVNVSQSDGVDTSENVFRSMDIHRSKNVLFSEGGVNLEYVVASSRSIDSSFCIRVEDSRLCSNSFNVIWSAKVTNSLFIQDCFDVMDCMFCSHIAGKRFCIANMQFSEEEYYAIKEKVIRWILTS